MTRMRRPLRLLSLCSGIGGIDYAWSHLLGQEIAGQVENDPYCQALLQQRWPDVMKRSDIREVQGDEFGPIDVVAGGVPCQPFSLSGQRRGTQDDRHLWPAAFAIIERGRPAWVLIENVFGFVSLALDLVQADLESAGYTTQAYVLPACAVGAPHIRERVFIVAHTTSPRRQDQYAATGIYHRSEPSSADMAYPIGRGCGTWRTQRAGQSRSLLLDGGGASCMAYPCSTGRGQWTNQSQPQPECRGTSDVGDDGPQGDMAYAHRQRQQERDLATGSRQSRLVTRGTHADGDSAQRPSQPRMGGGADGVSEGVDSHQWPSAPNQAQEEWEPSRTIPYKLPYRAARLKALGNAVVPQQVYPILKAIVEIEQAAQEVSA